MQILLSSQDPWFCSSIQRTLPEDKYTIHAVADCLETLNWMLISQDTDHKPDVLILDASFQDRGLTMLKTLEQHCINTPILIASSDPKSPLMDIFLSYHNVSATSKNDPDMLINILEKLFLEPKE